MSVRSTTRHFFRRGTGFKASREAYDLWAGSYDRQPGNLMLDLDADLVKELLAPVSLRGRELVDLGCGTGRHWPLLLEMQPARIRGFDSSPGMIDRLKEKFNGAQAFVSDGPALPGVADGSVDLLISTLTIAHIEAPAAYFKEWHRVLKPGGLVLITDYHPEALARGAKRTFRHQNETIAIRNHVHSLDWLRSMAGQLGWDELRFIEKRIDKTVRSYYEAQNALDLYESFLGTPIIYGMLLKKS